MLTELLRLLDAARGLHNFMAQDSGVSQTVISRTYLRAAEPRITSAERMLEWLRANESRFDELRAKRMRERRRPSSRVAGSCERMARFEPAAQQRTA
jgi:predicted transcriptional regulator